MGRTPSEEILRYGRRRSRVAPQETIKALLGVEQVIVESIKTMHALRVRYHNKTRVLEPYLLDEYADERRFLLAWMVRCEEEPQKSAGWQHYLLSEMQAVDVLPDRFDGTRAGYNPVSDDRVRRTIRAVPAL